MNLKMFFYRATSEKYRYKIIIFYYLGAATVRLEMPVNMQSALIFHYNLKLYNKETDNFEGISLKRFVMQVNKVCINKRFNINTL